MPAIAFFNGIFSNYEPVIQGIEKITGYRLITDDMVVIRSHELSEIPEQILNQAFSSTSSVFNKFTHEKERSIAYLKLALSQLIGKDDCIVSGYTSLLIPETLIHTCRICLISDHDARCSYAQNLLKISKNEAESVILQDDQNKSAWTNTLFSNPDPWNSGLYDLVVSLDQAEPEKVPDAIMKKLSAKNLCISEDSVTSMEDFLLSALTEVSLINSGHHVTVQSASGNIILTINKHVLMIERLEEELKAIAGKVPGVLSVKTRTGKNHGQSSPYKKRNTGMPSKVLLVDDEKEFVQTLSERLQMREIGSVVAYDGTTALNLVQHDHPEVMIIDLKMPEMDGMEILTQVKQVRPSIEVIVLTGHGSENDRIKCMDLGAFAYMQKPVDINLLSDALKQAHEKVNANL